MAIVVSATFDVERPISDLPPEAQQDPNALKQEADLLRDPYLSARIRVEWNAG